MNNNKTLKQLKFINQKWSLKEYLLNHSATINNSPIGQRRPVEKNMIGGAKPSKAQAIINVIFSGDDLSEIKIADISNRKTQFKYESIDGGHRKRSIVAFFRGEFPTHATSVIGQKYFSQLTDEEKEYFFGYVLRFVIYSDISKFDIGKQFRVTNTTTDVNFIEQMNSYGDLPFANMIRDLVMGNNAHRIFDWHLSSDKKKVISDYLQFDNHRLRQMHIVSRLAVSRFDETWTTTDEQIQELYEKEWSEKELSTLKKKIENVLDYMFECTQVRKTHLKTGLTEREFVALYRFIKVLMEEYGNFSIRVPKFWLEFKNAYDIFNANSPKGFARNSIQDSKGERRIADAFMGYLWEHGNEKKILMGLDWLKKAFVQEKINILDLIIVKDKKRFFPRELIETTLSRQKYICWIDEEPLTMNDAVGAHINAHSLGGKTTEENLVVVRKKHNTAMGEMNAIQYKELYMA